MCHWALRAQAQLPMDLDHPWLSYFKLLLLIYKCLKQFKDGSGPRLYHEAINRAVLWCKGCWIIPNPWMREQGLGMFLSCPGFPLQTSPVWTPPQIPVVLVAVLPSSLSGNSWYSQFSGPGILDDLGFFYFASKEKGWWKIRRVQIMKGVPGLIYLL